MDDGRDFARAGDRLRAARHSHLPFSI